MPDDEVDETDIQFQEAFGAQLSDKESRARSLKSKVQTSQQRFMKLVSEATTGQRPTRSARKADEEDLEPPTKSSRSSVGSRDGQ